MCVCVCVCVSFTAIALVLLYIYVLFRLLGIAAERGVKAKADTTAAAAASVAATTPDPIAIAAAAVALPTGSSSAVERLTPRMKRSNSVRVLTTVRPACEQTLRGGGGDRQATRVCTYKNAHPARQTNSLFIDQTLTNLVDTDSIIERSVRASLEPPPAPAKPYISSRMPKSRL